MERQNEDSHTNDRMDGSELLDTCESTNHCEVDLLDDDDAQIIQEDGFNTSTEAELINGTEGIRKLVLTEDEGTSGEEESELMGEKWTERLQDEAVSGRPANDINQDLARIHNKVRKKTVSQVRDTLQSLGLDNEGSTYIIRKRLKEHYKTEKLGEAVEEGESYIEEREFKGEKKLPRSRLYDFYVVIDFEATCDAGHVRAYRHEIIEFPAVLVSSRRCQMVAEFQSYIRPVINPHLTDFCTRLTGITQGKVNTAPGFREVLQMFEGWLKKHGLTRKKIRFAVVTDGPWDMGRFLFQQCKISKVPYPSWAMTWINIRKIFSSFYKVRSMSLNNMLMLMGMKFKGRPHCGLDDSRNIARIVIELSKNVSIMRVNETIMLDSKNKDKTVLNIRRPKHHKKQHGMHDGRPNRNKHNREKELEGKGGEEEEEVKEIEKEESKVGTDVCDKKEFPELENRSQECKDGRRDRKSTKKKRGRKKERT